MKLQTGILIRRNQSARFFRGLLAEIIGFSHNSYDGGSLYNVRILEGSGAGLIERWDTRNFYVELPREPDWEI